MEVDDDRVEVHTVDIESVDIDDAGVTIHYSYEYNGYAACKDIDLSGQDDGRVRGRRQGNTWVFDVYVSPEPLSPSEEL